MSALRIRLAYLWRHGRAPDLARPTRFTELVQVRKLIDRNPLFPILADKIAVKRIVADRLGAEWVTPTLWQGTALPVQIRWDVPFVVKARHGCNQNAFVSVRRTGMRSARARRGGCRRHMASGSTNGPMATFRAAC